MTLARLLPATLVLCSLPVFAQDQQSRIARASTLPCRESSVTGCPVVGSDWCCRAVEGGAISAR